jgi:hypothetical protein
LTYFGGLDPRSLLEQHPQDDVGLQSRQCGPDAEVCALAERDMPLAAAAVEAELIGVVELLGVAVGGSPHQEQARIGRHVDPGQRGVFHDVAVVTAKRRLVAQISFSENNVTLMRLWPIASDEWEYGATACDQCAEPHSNVGLTGSILSSVSRDGSDSHNA